MSIRQSVTRLLLVGLLLALLLVPVVSMASDVQAVDNGNFHFTLFQAEGTDDLPAAVIACNGGSDGSCGG